MSRPINVQWVINTMFPDDRNTLLDYVESIEIQLGSLKAQVESLNSIILEMGEYIE